MRASTRFLAVLLLTGAAGRARAQAPTVLDIAADKSSLKYTVVHQLHTVEGTSHKLQGRAALQADGTLQVMLRAPINSFESGNTNRDEHMQEAVEAPQFPMVSFKAMAKGAKDLLTTTTPQRVELIGEVEFHGVKRRESIPVDVEFRTPTQGHVTGHFVLSLDGYHVERPSLLMVKINDELAMDLDVTVSRSVP